MRNLLLVGVGAATIACSALAAQAQTFAISIGIRETGTAAPIGGNGGSANGIEWVNLDGQTLNLDGTFQTFTFNFQTDALTAFAGTTANGTYDGTRGVLEHIRIRNTGGVTAPVRLFIDNIVNTTQAGAVTVSNFEGFADGLEVTFQEPRFSGSTTANLMLTPNASLTTSTFASQGTTSDQIDFQFIDADPTRWVRLSTFNTPNLPNPTIEFAPGDRLSFQIRGVIVPEPASASLLAAGAGLLLARRRK